MNSSDFLELYLSQFFTSLGQLSAMLVSATVAAPMYSYYMRRNVQVSADETVNEETQEESDENQEEIDQNQEENDDTVNDDTVNDEN